MSRTIGLAAIVMLLACNDDDAYTVSDCEADGGTVVTGIGDGPPACPAGSSSLGSVTMKDGKPVAEEGAICCGS